MLCLTEAKDQVINRFGKSDWSSKFNELKAATVSSGLRLKTSISGDTLTAAIKHYHKTALEGNYAITAYLVEKRTEWIRSGICWG